MDDEARKRTIVAILGSYAVRFHYRASRGSAAALYVVFKCGEQVTEPMRHHLAQRQKDQMVAEDILTLFRNSTDST